MAFGRRLPGPYALQDADDQTVDVRDSDVEHRASERDAAAQNRAADQAEKQGASATSARHCGPTYSLSAILVPQKDIELR